MDWSELTLFLLILARMSGCVLFNPLLGRQSVPGIVKSGLILLLAVTAAAMTEYRPAVPDTLLEMAVRLLLEMGLGYILGLVVNVFFIIPLVGGELIDVQMGMSMGKTYDPGSQSSVSVTATMLNILMMLLFLVANGHQTLLRIFLVSGEIVPFGTVALGETVYAAVVELFLDCVLMSIKLCMPVLAAELLGQVGMGILMKVIPQINVFAINIELKVIIGLSLLLVLMAPFSEFLLEAESTMLRALRSLLPLMAG